MNSPQDLIELTRTANVSYSSAGTDGPAHLAGALLAHATGTQMTHLPFRGAAPDLAEVTAGGIGFTFDTMSGLKKYVSAQRVKPIANTAATRHPDFPTVPTMTESGIKAFDDVGAWFGFLAPAIVARLNSVIACQGLAARTPCRTGHGAIGWPAVGFQNLPRGRLHAVDRAHQGRRHQGGIGRTTLAVPVDRSAWITND